MENLGLNLIEHFILMMLIIELLLRGNKPWKEQTGFLIINLNILMMLTEMQLHK